MPFTPYILGTLGDQWQGRMLHLMDANNPKISPRGKPTVETIDPFPIKYWAHACFIDSPSRNLNYRFMVAEWLWMMFGYSDVESLARYNSVMRQFSDDGERLAGAYGPHIRAQMPTVLHKLADDHDTRQAVIEIPRVHQNPNTKDNPCTLSFQFLYRDSMLNLIVTMRSSDIWLGIPYDAFNFAQLLNCVSGAMDWPAGWVSIHTGSSHMYLEHFHLAAKTLAAADTRTKHVPPLNNFPPDWLRQVLENPKPTGELPLSNPWELYARMLSEPTSAGALYNFKQYMLYNGTSPEIQA